MANGPEFTHLLPGHARPRNFAGASSTFANWGACELFALGPGKPQIKIAGIIFSRLIFFKVTRVRRARKALTACMACASASHEFRTRPSWSALSVGAACCSAVTRPLGLVLRASFRNDACAVESHPGYNGPNIETVLLSTIYIRNIIYLNTYPCAFGCMRVVMWAHMSPMQRGEMLGRCKRLPRGMQACEL